MKSSFALVSALGVVLALAILLGVAQTTPSAQAAPAVTTTPSATPTVTAIACDTRPPAPTLKRPNNKSTLGGTVAALKWQKTECATKYRVVVRRGAKKGALVMLDKTRKHKVNTPSLARGYTYFWYVKACAQLCSRSATWQFTVPGGAPPPTKAPGTPAPPPPHGTPVPGSPPPNLLNYQGSSVYLSNDSDGRWYSDCAFFKWRPYPGTIYLTALWFYPGEKVKLEVQDFNLGTVFKTGTYTANGAGLLDLAFDTSSWTKAHHYHLWFTGQSSGAKYCGHFDLPLDNGAPRLDHGPHSAAELKAGKFLNEP